MAAARVFGIAELLEMILHGLDERTLLLSQRVDKAFSSIITDSSRLQHKLFFTDESLSADMDPEHEEIEGNKTGIDLWGCLLYTSPSPRDGLLSRMPSSA